MRDLSRYLFLAAGVVFVLLAVTHVVLTPQRPEERKGLAPVDRAIAESMARAPVRLSHTMNMWGAWVGFNLSHSLGVGLLGLMILLIGRTPSSFVYNAAFFLPLAIVASLAYLAIAFVYWYRGPVIGVGVAVVLLMSAWALPR
jgi:hypothetical protein